MNILTKICIVVLLVLLLIGSAVFITAATVFPNWREAYNKETQRRQLGDMSLRLEKLASLRLAKQWEDEKARADKQAIELADAKATKVPTPEELRTAELHKLVQATQTQLAELQLTVKAMSDRNAALIAELDKSRQQIDGLQKANLQAALELTQVRGELTRAERVVQGLQRELASRDEQIRELERRVTRGVTAPKDGEVAPAVGKFTGTITALRGELGSINVGSAQGVARGQKLYVYRDASFVGYLRIDDVDEGQAAGTVVEKQLDPAVGDKVTNDLSK